MSYRNLLIILLLFFLNSCASYAPLKWLPDTNEIQTGAYGGWITLFVEDSVSQKKPLKNGGEFISADEKYVYIFSDSLDIIPKEKIVSVDLEIDDKNTGEYSLWTVGGCVSTMSNGLYLIFTAPVWLASGIAVATGEANRDRYKVEKPDQKYWDYVLKFSRFPQGIKNIRLDKIQPKPIENIKRK